MKNLALISLAVLALTGCATSKDYQLYAETQQKIAQANAMAETARYAALAEIAKAGDTTSRVAAVMSLQLSGGGQGSKAPQQVAPPKSWSETALQWTSVLLPSVTQMYGINANKQVAITQSNNAAAVARSTNETFATMNGNMATSNTSIATAGLNAATTIANNGLAQVGKTAADGLTATTNVANTGIAQVGTTAAAGLTATTTVANSGLTAASTISTSANTAMTNVSNAANTSIQTLANQIPNLQPNVTTTTSNTSNSTTNTTTNTTAPASSTAPTTN